MKLTISPDGNILYGKDKIGEWKIGFNYYIWNINTCYGIIGSCTNYITHLSFHLRYLIDFGYTPKNF